MSKTQSLILSRALVNPSTEIHELDEFTLDIVNSCNHSEFMNLINRWKYLLVDKYRVCPGQKVLIEMGQPGITDHAVIFAAWELGLTLIVDWPHAYGPEDLDNYRYTMHGKVDYAVVTTNPDGSMRRILNSWDEERTRRHVTTIIGSSELVTHPINNEELFNNMRNLILATEDSIAIASGSGGTIGIPKKTIATHRDVYLQSKRMAELSKFEHGNSTLHTVNLHHGASACYYFLPSYFAGSTQYIFTGNDRNKDKKVGAVIRYKINNVFLYTSQRVHDFLDTIPVVDHPVSGVTLFMVTEQSLQLLKEKNIKQITSIFGDTTIGYGLFLRTVDQTTDISTYEKNFVGTKQDECFDFKIENGFLYVKSDSLEFDWKTSKDRFECRDEKYYFLGRGDKYRIGNEWLDIGDIDSAVTEAFGNDNATLVIDFDQQKLYLAIWRNNAVGEQLLREWFSRNYREVNIDFVTTDLDSGQFFVSRKIDRHKLRIQIRGMLASK